MSEFNFRKDSKNVLVLESAVCCVIKVPFDETFEVLSHVNSLISIVRTNYWTGIDVII